MPIEEFITRVFCLIDDLYQQLFPTPLRQRGSAPKLADSEVITMEIVGEWQGHHTDMAIWKYFSQHWTVLFPTMPARSQFARQAANLWVVKQTIQAHLVHKLGADTVDTHLIDGFPVEACVRTRAARCRSFKADAEFGYCASKKHHFYGFQGHLLIDARGVPVAMELAAANIDERDAAYDLIENIAGLLIGDKGYIRPEFTKDCEALGINIQTPLRKNMKDSRPKNFVKLLMRVRRRIETVIGQLAEYFEIERIRCRDLWHLTSRMSRKLLGYTTGVYLNIQAGRAPMQFEHMISA